MLATLLLFSVAMWGGQARSVHFSRAAWPSSLSKLCGSAQAVVSGHVILSGSDPIPKMRVTSVLKGDPLDGKILALHLPAGFLLEDERVMNGIAFLSWADGMWELMPMIDGGVGLDSALLPALASPVAEQPGITLCEDRVIKQLIPALTDSNIDYVRAPLIWLLDYDSPVLRAELSRLLYSEKLPFRLLGELGLLRFGDVDALRALERDADALAGSETMFEVASTLILCRNPDPRGIAILERLAANHAKGRHELAQAAADCLRAIQANPIPH
jgi:hypothetical protein